MPTQTKPKIKVAVLPITTPATTHEQHDYTLVADMIERAMQAHPTWRQAHGVEYRRGRATLYGGGPGERPTDLSQVTGACAYGMAKVGAVGWEDREAAARLAGKLIQANDQHRWSLRKIVDMLRLGAKER